MQKTLEDSSRNGAVKNFTYLAPANSSKLNLERDNLNKSTDCVMDTCAVEGSSKSEEVKSVCDRSFLKAAIKKSQSLGSGLDMKGRDSGGSASEDEIDQQFSCDDFHDNCGSIAPNGAKDSGANLPCQFQEALAPQSDSLHVTNDNHESMFSIGDAPQSEKEFNENSAAQLSGVAESGDHVPQTTPVFVKSSSFPNISSPSHPSVHNLRHSRSAEDLNVLDWRRRDSLMHEIGTQELQHQARNDIVITNHNENNGHNHVDDNYGTCNYVCSAKDWIIPMGDEVYMDNGLLGNSSSHKLDKLPSRDFKIKRIEEWVSDLQHCSPLEESDEPSASEDHVAAIGKNFLAFPSTATQAKVYPGMEAVKKYLSSLSPAATAAQLVNHGLVVIPFLSAFSSLKALNLAGNAIGKKLLPAYQIFVLFLLIVIICQWNFLSFR